MRSELESLPRQMAEWRMTAPSHSGMCLDPLSMAVITCLEEYRYYEAAPVINLLIERFHAIEATMSHDLLGASPTLMSPSIVIAPSSDSDGQVTRMGVAALEQANRTSWQGLWR